MRRLFLIRKPNLNNTAYDLLRIAAERRGVEVFDVQFDSFNFIDPPVLTKEDALYSLSFGYEARMLEKLLLNDQVTTFYTDYHTGMTKPDNVIDATLIHQKNNLPIIPSIFVLSTDKATLKAYVEQLGGYPVVIKGTGGSHGKGVMKIDSLDSLASVCDYLSAQTQSFILRKYIPHTKQARIIVLGDSVIAAHQNYATMDFRSNVGDNTERRREVVEYDTEIHTIAVAAVRSINYEFGGVDILFDESTNKPYIAEVNFPCYFTTTQRLTGIDIADQMVAYLESKTAR